MNCVKTAVLFALLFSIMVVGEAIPPRGRMIREATWREFAYRHHAGWRTLGVECAPSNAGPWPCWRVDVCWTVAIVKDEPLETQVVWWEEEKNKYWLLAVPTREVGKQCHAK